MKQRRSHWTLRLSGSTLAAVLVCTSSPVSSGSHGAKLFQGTFSLIAQLSDENHPSDLALQAEIDRASDAISAIAAELDRRTSDPPSELLKSADAYREQLNLALIATSLQDKLNLLKDLNGDAKLKIDHTNQTSGFSPFERSMLITVTVMTVRAAQAEPGYTIICNPFRDAKARENAKFPFASETNNASLPMPPGHYFLQIYKGANLVLGRGIIVGKSSTSNEIITIDVTNY